ncbi:hypothetical protein ES705_26860 [subsurface metagenome]
MKKQSPEQTKLYIKKSGEMKPVRARAKVELIYKTRQFSCPFCLYIAPITRFLIKLKNRNYSEKRFHCPDCEQIMNRDTLVREMSIEEYAEWILDAKAWDRISFQKFKTRLRKMNIAYKFWGHYKKYKAEKMEQYSDDEEEDYKAQEEWAKERGLIPSKDAEPRGAEAQ